MSAASHSLHGLQGTLSAPGMEHHLLLLLRWLCCPQGWFTHTLPLTRPCQALFHPPSELFAQSFPCCSCALSAEGPLQSRMEPSGTVSRIGQPPTSPEGSLQTSLCQNQTPGPKTIFHWHQTLSMSLAVLPPPAQVLLGVPEGQGCSLAGAGG